jgi:hypothetical protein
MPPSALTPTLLILPAQPTRTAGVCASLRLGGITLRQQMHQVGGLPAVHLHCSGAAIAALSTNQPVRGGPERVYAWHAPTLTQADPLIRGLCLPPGSRGAPGIFSVCGPGSRSHASAMDTTTVHPQGPAAG